MAILTMAARAGDWLKSEAPEYFSREAQTVLAGSGTARVLTSGMVVARVLTGAAVGAAVSGNTGGGAITAAPTVGAGAKAGTYNLRCIKVVGSAGDFEVRNPDGQVIGIATTAVEFAQGGLTFTVADGSPDFAVGDAFTIVVAAGSLKVVQLAPAGTNGQDEAYGLLVDAVTAAVGTDGSGVVIVRQAVLNDSQVTWPTITAAKKATEKARLTAVEVLFRTGV